MISFCQRNMYTLHKYNYKWSNYYNDNIQFDVSIAWRSSTRKIKSLCKNVMQSPLLYIDYIHMMVHEHTYMLFYTSFCISYPLSISHCVCQNALCNSIFMRLELSSHLDYIDILIFLQGLHSNVQILWGNDKSIHFQLHLFSLVISKSTLYYCILQEKLASTKWVVDRKICHAL